MWKQRLVTPLIPTNRRLEAERERQKEKLGPLLERLIDSNSNSSGTYRLAPRSGKVGATSAQREAIFR